MTLAASNPIISYVGTSQGNEFPFPFDTFQSSDLVVTVVDPNGNGYALALATDYSVLNLNGSGSPAAQPIVILGNNNQAWLTNGNLITGWTLTIKRVLALSQTVSIRNQGDFYRTALEDAVDRVVMMIQQLQAQVSPLPANTTYVRLYQKVLSGTLNGINTIFTTPTIFIAGTEEIFVGGVALQSGTDYTVTGANQITFAVAPLANQAPLWASYNL